jgi:NAD(P)-dependent dehydrogenase (short-subunit alcohol dehydrogenase family)
MAGRKHRTSVDDGPPPGVVIGAPGIFEGYVRRHMWAFYVLFLISPAAAYITGQTLPINGGTYMP